MEDIVIVSAARTGVGKFGGSLAKIGTRTLTLTGANQYTGGTTVTSGDFIVSNSTGSATGTSRAKAWKEAICAMRKWKPSQPASGPMSSSSRLTP